MNHNDIRNDFPILNQKDGLIYFDNAATTLKPQSVIDAVNRYNSLESSNIHRGDYDLSIRVSDAFEGVRKKVARFINADPNEIVFTSSATQSLNMVNFGYGRKFLKKDDVVLVSVAEHASNLLPWFLLVKEIGIKLKYIPLTESGKLTIENFKKAMHPNVKVVSIAHITNVMGHIVPIKEIAAIAHQYGAIIAVDGAQSVPHLKTDVKDLDVDFLSFSSHKMCGPTGVGVLYGKFELLDQLDPLMVGGGSNARFDIHGNLMLKRTPVKFEAGTPPIGGVMGLGAAIDYLSAIGMENIMEHERELRSYLMAALNKLDNFKVYNHDATSGIIALNVDGIFPQDVSVYLNSKNIAIRAGDHCAKLLVNLIGVPNTVRVSFYFYNTKEEVDKLIEAFQEITLEKCIELAI